MINKEYKNVFIKKFKAFFKSLIYNSYSLFNKNIFLPGTINLQKKVVSAKSTEIREININNDDIFKITIESNFHTLKNQNVNKFKIDFGYSEKPPNGYWEIKNAIYHPSYHCLFSDLGKRIDFSCYSTKLLCMPEYLEIPKKLKFTDEEFIYIGDFMAEKHYGHFLIEATSSLFYILNNRATKVLCNEISRPFKTTFIDLFYKNFIEDKVFFKFTELVQINSVIIPYPTLKFGNCIYNSHKIPFELVANNIVSKNSKNRTAKKEKAIYLSAENQKKRSEKYSGKKN